MITGDKPNPFFVLALPTDATRADIVQRGQELYDTAESKEEGLLFRWATEQLLTNPRTRLEYELFELPDTLYEDPAWDSFVRVNKKKPVDLKVITREAVAPSVDDINMAALLQLFLDNMLTLPEADIAIAIAGSPFKPVYKLPLEVRDVIFG